MMNSILAWRPDSWFDYFLLYLTPGVAMTSFLLIKTVLEKPSEFAQSVMKMMGKEETWLDKLKEAAVFSFGIACALVGWPGFVVWSIKKKQDEAMRQKREDEPDFTCLAEYLIAAVNPIDAEIASYIVDPLSTVPTLPFGHLNQGWVNFLSNMTDDRDEMWSFSVSKGSKCGKRRFAATSDIRGYARVRDGKVLGEFITESD
jgi:hypothetical protein